jgi:dTMP kinase
MKPIRYISLEGVIKSGKTTQSKLLVKKLQRTFPKMQIVLTKEPGGSEIADAIRKVVQGTAFEEDMDPVCEQYLYAASRAQTLRTIVKPVLDNGGLVIADRSVYTSIAFQGFGRGLRPNRVIRINEPAVDGLWPHAVLFINIDISTAMSRIDDIGGDKFEAMDREFFERCLKGYRYVMKNFPHVHEIDGNGSIEEVEQQIDKIVAKLLRISNFGG